MEFKLLLKSWMELSIYIKLVGLVGFFLTISFMTYQINRINVHLREKSLKQRLVSLYIFTVCALMGSLGFALGPLFVAFPSSFQYLIVMILASLFSLSLIYSMWSLYPDVPGIVSSEVSYGERLIKFPATFFKALQSLIDRIIRATLAPGQDLWGILIGVSLLLLLPYGFISDEAFSKVICLTLGGMGLTLSLCESLAGFFKYSAFLESLANKQRLYQLVLGMAGSFLGVILSEFLFLTTLQAQEYYLILGTIAGLFIGIGTGIPLSQVWLYQQQLQREQERQQQIEKSDVEKILARISRHIEDYRRLIPLSPGASPMRTPEDKLQAIKSEFLSGKRPFRELKELSLQLENQLKELIRSTYRAQTVSEEAVTQSTQQSDPGQSHQPDKKAPVTQERKTTQPDPATRFTRTTQVGPKTPLTPEESKELRRSVEQTMAETRSLIEELKTKYPDDKVILANLQAREARLNGLKRKLEGRRITLTNAQIEATEIKEAVEVFSYYVASTQSADEIKPLTEAECREMLNVSATASVEEIKKAYKKLAILYHPDKYVNSPPEMKDKADKAFKRINEAYQILTRQTG